LTQLNFVDNVRTGLYLSYFCWEDQWS